MLDHEDSDHIREVFAQFGLAMYLSNVLEHGMANALLYMEFIASKPKPSSQADWERMLDHYMDSIFDLTFGNMLRRIKKLSVPPEVTAQLDLAKVQRDRLAHSFFRANAEQFATRPGQKSMIEECAAAGAVFEKADALLGELVRPLMDRAGISDDLIEHHLRERIESARANQAG